VGGNERRDAEPRDYEDRGKLNKRPGRSEAGGDRDHHAGITDHHRERGDHDAVERVITMPWNRRSRWRGTRTWEQSDETMRETLTGAALAWVRQRVAPSLR